MRLKREVRTDFVPFFDCKSPAITQQINEENMDIWYHVAPAKETFLVDD